MSESASYLPSCWSDDDRMSSLMAMFKKREINPIDYDSKLKFWSELIETSCRQVKRPCFAYKELMSRFRRKDRIPSCFDVVLRDMIAKGQIVTVDTFLTNQGWLSWGMEAMVKRPLSWLFGYSEPPLDFDKMEFVFPCVVKEIGQRVVEFYQDRNEVTGEFNQNVIEWKRFLKDMAIHGYDEQTLTLVVAHLQRTNKVSIAQSHIGEKLLKFEAKVSSGPVAITESERTFYRLQKTAESLESEMTRIEEGIEKLDQEVREQLRAKNRPKAKQLLRRKKELLKKVEQKDAAYNNVVGLMQKVAQTKEQRDILDAYKAGVDAFKSDMARHGISPDKVDETMDDIQEAIADHHDISEALARSPVSTGGISDAELEDELADLLNERTDEIYNLPDVPTTVPSRYDIATSSSDRLKQLRRDLEGTKD